MVRPGANLVLDRGRLQPPPSPGSRSTNVARRRLDIAAARTLTTLRSDGVEEMGRALSTLETLRVALDDPAGLGTAVEASVITLLGADRSEVTWAVGSSEEVGKVDTRLASPSWAPGDTSILVPIVVGGAEVGSIRAWRSRCAFSAGEVALLGHVAAHLASGMAEARLHRDRDEEVRVLTVLNQLSLRADLLHDPVGLARLVVTSARELTGAVAILRWWDEGAARLVVLADGAARPDALGVEFKPDLDDRIAEAAFRVGEMVADSVAGEAGPVQTSSGLALPLAGGGRTLGVLSLTSPVPYHFTPPLVEVAVRLAGQVTPILEAAWGAHRFALQASSYGSVRDFAAAISGVLDPIPLAQMTAQQARALVGAQSVSVALWDPDRERLSIVADTTSGPDTSLASMATTPVGMEAWEAFTEGTLVLVQGRNDPAEVTPALRPGQSLAAIPFRIQQRPWGVLIARSSPLAVFTKSDLELLSLVLVEVAPAFEAAQLHTELEEARSQLAQIVGSAPVTLFAIDQQGAITFTGGDNGSDDDSAAGDLAGDDPDPLGRSIHSVFAEPRVAEVLDQALRGELDQASVRLDRQDVDLEFHFSPITDSQGEVTAVIGTCIDVSARASAQRAIAANEQKSRFLASMSHELRTPLNSILGFAQLLQDPAFGELSERQVRYLGHIRASGHHLVALINDILDLSKVVAGQMEIQSRPVRIKTALDDLRARLGPMADGKHLATTIEAPAELAVLADPTRLTQVLWNLMSNAVKFTPEHGAVAVRACKAQDQVVITISDTGIGIPRSQFDRIFEEFTQVDVGATRSHEGTGLGLALTKRLIDLMKGSITLESEVGRGTTFTMRLPLA